MSIIPLDPDVAAALELMAAEGLLEEFSVQRGDFATLRDLSDQSMANGYPAAARAMLNNAGAPVPVTGVAAKEFTVLSVDGTPIAMRWYTPEGSPQPGSAALYIHGGGMLSGSVDIYDPMIRLYVQLSGVPLLAVGYRLAPEYPGLIPSDDCVAALDWLFAHAEMLGVDDLRIGVMGDSAGGGLAASVAIRARDSGKVLKRQILIYPMLDDRNTVDPDVSPAFVEWNHSMNYTGWHALLGDQIGAEDVAPELCPGRLADFSGMAAAFIEVGEIDIFRDESLAYASGLWNAQVSCELHVLPGAPHGFEYYSPAGALTARALVNRAAALRAL